ncbi:Wzz/FepE/Etk N-terminal domain-containing protein [Photobacterium sp. DNB22_13_2]
MEKNNSEDKDNYVDLGELTSYLFSKKHWILLTSIAFGLISLVYTFTSQEWWTSTAEITSSERTSANKIREDIATADSALSTDESDYIMDNILSEQNIFKEFITAFNSKNNKEEFIQKNEDLQELSKSKSIDNEEELRKFIDEWTYEIRSLESDRGFYNVSFSYHSASGSKALLNEYLIFINQKVNSKTINSLNSYITRKEIKLTSRMESLKRIAALSLETEKTKTEFALRMADAAGLERPMQQIKQDEMFPIELGSKALDEKRTILSSLKDLTVFEPELAFLEEQLKSLSRIKIEENASFNSVRFLEKPNLPFSRDNPSRKLILLIGLLLGAFLSMATLICRFFYKQ